MCCGFFRSQLLVLVQNFSLKKLVQIKVTYLNYSLVLLFLGKKSFWQIGLQSLAIYAGHNHLINFLNIELVPKIQEKFQFKDKTDKIQEEMVNNYDIDNLAMITAYGISLCSEEETEIEMCEDFLVSCLSSSNLPSSITLKDLNFSMVTSHLEPRLSCFSDTIEFPILWSEEKTQYFCRVS